MKFIHRGLTKADLDSALEERDFDYLTQLICSDVLTPEVRQHLADILRDTLEGKKKFPRHRPRKREATGEKRMIIGERVCEVGGKRIAAIKQVAAEFGCSESKVKSCLREYVEDLLWEPGPDD
jgi:hypothetical protein